MLRKLNVAVLSALLAVGLIAQPAAAQEDSVASVASSSSQFDILVTLVVEAGLADALSATGDDDTLGAITVFAPTDKAFRRLVYELERAGGQKWWKALKMAYYSSEADVAQYIIDATGGGGEGLLDDVLLYHVSNALGAVPFDVAVTLSGAELPMLNGGSVTIDGVKGRWVRITDTNDVLNIGGKDRRSWVISRIADIPAGDDIIHPISRVLLP